MHRVVGLVVIAGWLLGCQQSGISRKGNLSYSPAIAYNQVAYLDDAVKQLVVLGEYQQQDYVIANAAGETVLSGQLAMAKHWDLSGQSAVLLDISSLTEPGKYVFSLTNSNLEQAFTIDTNTLRDVHDAALKSYYKGRAGMALSAEYAGQWARNAGHPDTEVMVHESAASAARPTGYKLSAPKGWYDAGDFNKYIVNSGITTYTLLAAYEHFSPFYQQHNGNIPESGDATPDILDEVMWNLSWMLAMQDPNDGGVYHKLTTKRFSGQIMPEEGTSQRYVVQKSTSAALNFSAVMATASRIYKALPEHTTFANQAKQAAILAWQWAQANPNAIYQQPSDIHTGEYGDKNIADEMSWAAAELFLLTNESAYLNAFEQYSQTLKTPSWSYTAPLGYISMLTQGKKSLPDAKWQVYFEKFLQLADTMVKQHQDSPYGIAMVKNDFVWGSNGVAMNKAMVLLNAYQLTGNIDYRNAAASLLDYVLGKNPTGFAFVTGFGVHSPMDIHHRQSYADDIVVPLPGLLAGGPQPGQQDGCRYPASLPATTYVDHWCSYSTNEIAINWNAPLVYVLAGLLN